MIKVKAKHWINADGTWHKAGEIFEIESIEGIEKGVEVIAEPESADEPEKPEKVSEKPVKAEKETEAVKPAARRRKSVK